MDFREKAQKRIEHWIKHNEQHQTEYAEFADELQNNGFIEAAQYVREMSQLTERSNQALGKALETIKK